MVGNRGFTPNLRSAKNVALLQWGEEPSTKLEKERETTLCIQGEKRYCTINSGEYCKQIEIINKTPLQKLPILKLQLHDIYHPFIDRALKGESMSRGNSDLSDIYETRTENPLAVKLGSLPVYHANDMYYIGTESITLDVVDSTLYHDTVQQIKGTPLGGLTKLKLGLSEIYHPFIARRLKGKENA